MVRKNIDYEKKKRYQTIKLPKDAKKDAELKFAEQEKSSLFLESNVHLSVRSSFNAPSIEVKRMGGELLRDTSDLRKIKNTS